MKKTVSLLLAFVLAFCITLPSYAYSFSQVNMIAHRGYSAVAPENTLAAVKEAGKAGFWGSEFDIQITKDKQWVVMHNSDICDMTDGSGQISKLTLEEIKACTIDAGNGLDRYPDEKVPTLEEYLNECAEYGLHPVCEIKDGTIDDMPSLVEYLSSRPDLKDIVIISFKENLLAYVKKALPSTDCRLLVSTVNDSVIETCLADNFDGVDFNYTGTTAENIQKAKEAGLSLTAWTVDSLDECVKLYNNPGVTDFTTNAVTPEKMDCAINPGSDTFFTEIMKFLVRLCNCIKAFLADNAAV